MKVFLNKIDSQNIVLSLAAMPDALSKKVMKPVLDQISSVGSKKMKANLQKVRRKQRKGDRWKNTGALLASIGTKPAKAMKKSGALFGGFGVRRSAAFAKNKLKVVRNRASKITTFGFKKVPRGSIKLATAKQTKKGRAGQEIRPSNYGHLVERGHGGPVPSKAYPFVEPTARQMEAYFSASAPTMIQARWEPVLTQLGTRFNKTISRGK